MTEKQKTAEEILAEDAWKRDNEHTRRKAAVNERRTRGW